LHIETVLYNIKKLEELGSGRIDSNKGNFEKGIEIAESHHKTFSFFYF